MKARRGDTIIEVIVAFTVFALLAVSTIYLMNRSLAVGQRSLEMTMVRQQVDTQAELLRYARDNQTQAWNQIRASALTSGSIGITDFTTCPTDPPTSSFVMNINPTSNTVERVVLSVTNFKKAPYYSRADISGQESEGLWITPVAVSGASKVYDMYIRGCWDSLGSNVPQVVSTIVRLYDT